MRARVYKCGRLFTFIRCLCVRQCLALHCIACLPIVFLRQKFCVLIIATHTENSSHNRIVRSLSLSLSLWMKMHHMFHVYFECCYILCVRVVFVVIFFDLLLLTSFIIFSGFVFLLLLHSYSSPFSMILSSTASLSPLCVWCVSIQCCCFRSHIPSLSLSLFPLLLCA